MGTIVARGEGNDPAITVRYSTREGKTVTSETTDVIERDHILRPGDQLAVIYDPQHEDVFVDARARGDYVLPGRWPTVDVSHF